MARTGDTALKTTMRSLAVRKYCQPSGYEVLELPVPTITKPDDVLIRVHAAGIMTGDTQMANGMFRFVAKRDFPYPISIAGAGTILAVGPAVPATLTPGTPVYGTYFEHGLFPPPCPGFASDYTVVPAAYLLPKPPNITFEEAAALAGTVLTAYQCVCRYLALTGQDPDSGDTATLAGKTVFIPAALSACGSAFVQVVKHVYGAERVISTVSTGKMPLVAELLPERTVDLLLDYQTQSVVQEVGRGQVDFVLNTQWDMVGTFPLVEPEKGAVVSIASVPGEETVRAILGDSKMPFVWLLLWAVRAVQWYYNWRLRGTNVKQEFLSGNMGDREGLERTGEWIAAGKIKAVMTVVDLDDIEAVRRECGKVAAGKGGLGKLVIRLV
ncbi:GroES-like protein [Chaetomidium leptoderma]|uniref:GroES-like protein n=1 Tax=Chaetomidium leptoderma TaxID=669021 RepID=A0AAN6VEC0_9PEZI|nr:GroES-like protein [Chaetomidium leptoderma]